MWNILRISCANTNISVGANVRWRLCKNLIQSQKSKPNFSENGKWFHFTRRKQSSSNCPFFYIKVGFGIATGLGVQVINLNSVYCKETSVKSQSGTRLVGVESSETEPKFEWKNFFILLKPFIWELMGAVIAALVCAALNIYIPRVLGLLVDVVQKATSSTENFLHDLKAPAMKLIGCYSLHSVFTFMYIYLLSKVGEGIAKTMKVELFSSIMKQDIAFFDYYRTGELINRLTVDINDFKSCFKQVISQGLKNSTQIIGCTITLLMISPQMTAGIFVIVPSVIAAGTVMGAMLRQISYKSKAQSAKVTMVADEAIGNIRTVRASAMEDLECLVFEEEAELARVYNVRLGQGIGLFQAGTTLFLNGMVLATISVGGYMMSQQKISAGDLMAFMVAVQILERSFTQLSVLFGSYIKGKHAGARVFEIMDIKPRIPLNQGAVIPFHSLVPEVEFKNVKFAYPGRAEHQVIKDISLKIPVGKTVAIVGSSGSGKSTLAWLLERFYDVDDGVILVGGKDIRRLNPKWLRGRVVGFISQEPVLFATTVMENIRYGRPSATDSEVVAAAKLANAHEFIQDFPRGYNTMVGERGASISGGQKQRIAIARALLKNPAVLILDEATSALDTESEQLVQKALDEVIKSRTTIVIAHRLSTIKNADLIVVLNKGVIVEVGTHDELMRKKGMYASLVNQQQLVLG